jgi:hypothetical protein
MSETTKKTKEETTDILTLRISKELKSKLEDVSKANLNSIVNLKVSRTALNYLKLSEIMIIREDSMKVGWDNSKLIIYHEGFLKDLIDKLNVKLSDPEKFTIWADMGDNVGKYLNDVLSISNVKNDDYLKIFQIIKAMGWFDYTINILDEANDIVLIPKSYMSQSFVYAFVYRLVQKARFPPEWNWSVLRNQNPFDPKKDSKEHNKWRDQYYIGTIQNVLQVDEEKQRDSNFYYFKRLKVPKKLIPKPPVNPAIASPPPPAQPNP